MALELAIETADGVEHPEAYWRLGDVSVDQVNGTARVQMVAYHTQAAADAGKAPITRRWVRVTFDNRLADLAYEAVKASRDVAVPAKRDDQYEPGEARLPDTMVGFFAGAIDV